MTTFSNSHSSLSLGSSGVSLKMCTPSICSWVTWSWPITRLVVRGLGSYKPFRGGNPRRGRRFLLLVVRIHPDILCMLVSGFYSILSQSRTLLGWSHRTSNSTINRKGKAEGIRVKEKFTFKLHECEPKNELPTYICLALGDAERMLNRVSGLKKKRDWEGSQVPKGWNLKEWQRSCGREPRR